MRLPNANGAVDIPHGKRALQQTLSPNRIATIEAEIADLDELRLLIVTCIH